MQLTEQPEAGAGSAPFQARLLCWLRARWRTRRGDWPGKDGAAALGRVIADLDRLNGGTERDFLKIGEKLAGFMEAVKLVSSELAGLADQLLGEQGARASEALTGALEHARRMVECAEGSASLLGGMRRDAERMKETLNGFKDTLATFHILGVLTRIETAHLGSVGANFGHLADDVKALADTIQGKIESAMETVGRLIAPIEGVLHGVSEHLEGRAKDLPRVLAELLAELEEFRAVQSRTREATLRLEARYAAISKAFNELIVSIQFHDITRQQVEHVVEALRRLRGGSGGAGNGGDPVAVLELQSLQLADAGGKFAASVATVGNSLDEIAANVLEMDGESRALSGVSGDAQNSFFLQMERKCTAIRAHLGGCAETEEAARSASANLGDTIDWMQGSIEEIQAIEIQVQRMALNASIRSDHIGAAGDALGTLAVAMQTLAAQSRERSDALTAAVERISQAAQGLSGHLGEARKANRGVSLEAIGAVAADLHSASERSFARIAQIAARSQRLREDIAAAREGFSAGDLFAEAIADAQARLREIGEGQRSGARRDGAGRWERDMADLAKHYTMQAERDVHAGVAGEAASMAPAPAGAIQAPPGFPSLEAAELGENVELF
jgi:hypothetical protein